jgi:hypothetical protein
MDVNQKIRKALHVVGDIDRDALNEVPVMSLDELVAFGQRVWWLSKRLNKVMDPVKVRIRDYAKRQEGTQKLMSLDGSQAIVSPQPASLVLRKDTDIDQLKAALGDKFDTVFDTVTVYKPKKDIQDQVHHLTSEQVNVIMSVVDMTDTTPKVSFKD